MVGDKAPEFRGTALVGGDATSMTPDNAFKEISSLSYRGKWLVFFFYPLDFTFVCPTELEDFGKHYEEFQKLDCEVVACSTDSQFSHLAWRSQHPNLRKIPYAMLADFTGANARAYEVLHEVTGYALRGLYIINPEGTLAYSVVHPEAVGRNTKEVLRVLKALQTEKLTPCGWNEGDDTLD